MEYVREGDTVIVESISRFGRSLPDLIELMNKLDEKGVHFKSLKEGDMDTTTATGKLVFNIFASLAQFERETIKERRKEFGITQNDLAKLAEININTLTQIERGKGNPTVRTLEKVLRIIGMELTAKITES